jgi:hypothetical protein
MCELKKMLVVFSFLIYIGNCAAQNWTSLGRGMNWEVKNMFTDTIANLLYIAGDFATADTVIAPGIVSWNGSSFSKMGCAFNWNCSDTNIRNSSLAGGFAICRYKGDLYVGGGFVTAENKPIKYLAKWNGTSWDSVGICPDQGVLGLYVDSANELIAVGYFRSIGGIPAMHVAKWNGTTWTGFGSGLPCSNAAAYSACEYKGELYVGGIINCPGISNMAKWDGSSWVSVGPGFPGGLSGIYDLTVYNNELIAAGSFTTADGNVTNNIARWNGTIWRDLGGGVSGPGTGQVFRIAKHNNQLYAVGAFTSAGGTRAKSIAKWDGNKWCGFGTNFIYANTAIGFLSNEMYVGCAQTINGVPVNYIAKWTGGGYIDTCGTLAGINELSLYSKFQGILFPNPNTGHVTLEYSLIGTEAGKLIIYTIDGRVESSTQLPVGQNSISLDEAQLTAGLYFCSYSIRGKVVKTEKLVIGK